MSALAKPYEKHVTQIMQSNNYTVMQLYNYTIIQSNNYEYNYFLTTIYIINVMH